MTTHADHAASDRWRHLPWGIAAALLALPAIAMQFTREVDWTASDFVTMGVLLGAACGVYELLRARSGSLAYRAGAGLAVVAAVLLIWVNLAVGIIGNEADDANMMFAGVLAVLVGGACIARLRPAGMARALGATAAAQGVVGVVAVSAGLGAETVAWPKDVIVCTAIFTALWLASAALFGAAARR